MADFLANNDSATTTSNVSEFSVSELSGAIKRTMEDSFGRVRVRGELGRVSRPASGHIYLDLKDDRAVLAGVIWKGAAAKMPVRPEEGLEVIATGRITTFPGQSKYQIVIDALEPAGEGALMALLEERKRRLAAEGLFDETRKKPLPYMPRTIGVVTSPTGAVIRDIIHRLNDRFPVHVIVWPVRVQGETSAQEVANAIRGFDTLDGTEMVPKPDLVIVARGGGSIEDLWGFNEEIVARAVAECSLPIISAVGHETDTTLIDYVSDLRAPTPTGAAEIAVPVRADLMAHTATIAARLHNAGTQNQQKRKERLEALARVLPQAERILELPRQRFDMAQQRLTRALSAGLEGQRAKLAHVTVALSPVRLETHLRTSQSSMQRVGNALPVALMRQVTALHKELSFRQARLTPEPLESRLRERRRQTKVATAQIDQVTAHIVERTKARAERAARLLDTLSYKSVLLRGFALVRDAQGKPIRSSKGIKSGDGLAIEFAGDDRLSVTAGPGQKTKQKPATKTPKPSDRGNDQGTLL